MSDQHSRTWTISHHAATLLVALVVLVAGLDRFGLWQPAELHAADMARDGATEHEALSRPPLQFAAGRLGFRWFGSTERGGRMPGALFAVIATLALALSVSSVSDARTGTMVGVVYATMPLVYMNARQMFGWSIAQSAFTIFFACVIAVLWARPPPLREPLASQVRYGMLLLLGTGAIAIFAGGWLLAAVPVLVGVGVAVAMRARHESWFVRIVGLALGVAGVVIGIAALVAMTRPLHGYQPLLGVGLDARAPNPFPDYDVVIEQVGHALFPWGGVVAFGLVRLFLPPEPSPGTRAAVDDPGVWRASGLRLATALVAMFAWLLETLHVQSYGVSPFLAAAPLAVAGGVLLRDAERSEKPWRIVAAMVFFSALIVWRDYELFPRTSYAALGLPEGGPMFPTGFSGKLADYVRLHQTTIVQDFFAGRAIAEFYFVVELGLFVAISVAALFQGVGRVRPFAFDAPYDWMLRIERMARSQVSLEFGSWETLPIWKRLRGPGAFAYLRVITLVVAVGVTLLARNRAQHSIGMPNLLGFWQALQFIPVATIVTTWVVLAWWNAFAYIGQPERRVMRALGTRIAYVLVGGIVVALTITQIYFPALSEHLSPRGAWAVIRRVRHEGEPVARFGGGPIGAATRYYADYPVRDLASEGDAVDWLKQYPPRHFLVIDGGSFPALNRAFRLSFPEGGTRRNIPVLETESNLYIAVSNLNGAPNHNPLDTIVLSQDTNTGTAVAAHWHPHGRRAPDRHFIPEPAVFNGAIEYLGFNLESHGPSVPVGGNFDITYHFHVLHEVPADYRMFVHLEGACPHINADHDPGEGKYPLRLWLAGDYIHDTQRVTVPPSCHAGTLVMYMGFYLGNDRMTVTGGDHDRENRVVAAAIVVR